MPHYARVAGILSIVSGTMAVLSTVLQIFWSRISFGPTFAPYGTPGFPPSALRLMEYVYLASFVIFMIVGVVSIIGGIFALNRRRWGVALAGAIAGIVVFFPCGIPALILINMARQEFDGVNARES